MKWCLAKVLLLVFDIFRGFLRPSQIIPGEKEVPITWRRTAPCQSNAALRKSRDNLEMLPVVQAEVWAAPFVRLAAAVLAPECCCLNSFYRVPTHCKS